jgi:NTE family protein
MYLYLFEMKCLRPTHISGSSAGAMVGGFLASGMKASEMIERVLRIKRPDIWDVSGRIGGGLLKGELFQSILEEQLPVGTIEECKVPFGATVLEVFRFRTKLITKGSLATAIRASCTFPLLFEPVVIEGTTCIDGGLFDDAGLMALPGVPPSGLVVNVICGKGKIGSSKLPERFKGAKVR